MLRPVKPENTANSPPHPVLLALLPETYGVMVYQEDVLRVAHKVAGMSLGEADLLRRAMSGKLRSREAMVQIEEQFVHGAMARGLAEADAREVWRQVSSFAGYSFCKGHSAAFAVLSYQVAYLKTHFPGEFFASVLSNEGGFYGAGTYLSEARRCGIEVRGPCVNRSELDYTGFSYSGVPMPRDPLPWVTTGQRRGWVRIGLHAIKGLSETSCERIIAVRKKKGEFRSIEDFARRTGAGLEETRLLIKCGAFDWLLKEQSSQSMPSIMSTSSTTSSIPASSRNRLLLKAECVYRQRELIAGGTLLDDAGTEVLPAATGDLSPFTVADICRFEMDTLGFMISAHPLDFVTPRGNTSLPFVRAREIRNYRNQRVEMAGWMIATKLLATKSSGKTMKMITLEDKTDTFEAVLFPRVYARFAPRTLTCGPFLVRGKVDMTLGSPTLNVEQLEALA